MSETGLGRGLDALMPDQPPAEGELKNLPVDRIVPNPDQPRERFDEQRMEELTESIRSQGVVEPVLVQPPDEQGQCRLIAGERRWRAACQAGLERIPALIRDIDDQQALAVSLIENVQRENLTPLEEAKAYRRLLDQHGWSQQQVGEAVGKSRSAIANRLRLLDLPEPARQALQEGRISAGHARALLGLPDEEAVRSVLERLGDEEWSVRQVEQAVADWGSAPESEPPAPDSPDPSSPDTERSYRDLESELEDLLGAPVEIHSKDRKQGHIRILFDSPDDFERLRDRFSRLEP